MVLLIVIVNLFNHGRLHLRLKLKDYRLKNGWARDSLD